MERGDIEPFLIEGVQRYAEVTSVLEAFQTGLVEWLQEILRHMIGPCPSSLTE